MAETIDDGDGSASLLNSHSNNTSETTPTKLKSLEVSQSKTSSNIQQDPKKDQDQDQDQHVEQLGNNEEVHRKELEQEGGQHHEQDHQEGKYEKQEQDKNLEQQQMTNSPKRSFQENTQSISQNFADFIELHCYEFLKQPGRRDMILKRIMFYLGLIPTDAIYGYGRLFNRLQIINILHDIKDWKSWTFEDWEGQIDRLEVIKESICRKDADLFLLPYKIDSLLPSQENIEKDDDDLDEENENFETKKKEKEQVREKCIKSVQDTENKAINQARSEMSTFTHDFAAIKIQMRMHQGLKMINEQINSNTDNVISMETLIKYRIFLNDYLAPYPEMKAIHIKKLDEFQEQIRKSSKQNTPKHNKKLWDKFTKDPISNARQFLQSVEELLSSWFGILPTPHLIKIKYDKFSKGYESKEVLSSIQQSELLEASEKKEGCLEFDEMSETQEKKSITSSQYSEEKSDDSLWTGRNVQKKKKRTKNPWSDLETQALIRGVEEYGVGNWTAIKQRFLTELKDRSNINIKDRYRTLLANGLIKK